MNRESINLVANRVIELLNSDHALLSRSLESVEVHKIRISITIAVEEELARLAGIPPAIEPSEQ